MDLALDPTLSAPQAHARRRDGSARRGSDRSEADWVGRTLGQRYRILRQLGSGGMGRVYLAKHALLDVQVAIKTPTDPGACPLLTKEALLLSRLQHPNIVSAIDLAWLADDTNYLVMDYVPGIAIDWWLERHGPFQPLRALRILRQLASAIDYCHAQQVVHRDIKPSNVMFDPEADDRVRLIDFGIACLRDDTAILPGGLSGTPEYMAPEQARGDARNRAIDMYGIAALALEMLTGSRPYDTDTQRQNVLSVVSPVPPSARGLRIPGLDAVIAKNLDPHPHKRFESASAFVSELEVVLTTASHVALPCVARHAMRPVCKRGMTRAYGIHA